MKNWQIIGFLAILIIGIVLISGCITKARSSAATTPPTPEIVYVTVTVTPTSTIARAVASASAPTITSQPGTQLASYTGDFGFDPTTELIYSFKGDVSINSGAYNSVQVIIRYPDSQTYNYDAGPMGGSNPTIKPFFIFPDTRFKNDEPTFYIQLDENKYTMTQVMTQVQNEHWNIRKYGKWIAYQN